MTSCTSTAPRPAPRTDATPDRRPRRRSTDRQRQGGTARRATGFDGQANDVRSTRAPCPRPRSASCTQAAAAATSPPATDHHLDPGPARPADLGDRPGRRSHQLRLRRGGPARGDHRAAGDHRGLRRHPGDGAARSPRPATTRSATSPRPRTRTATSPPTATTPTAGRSRRPCRPTPRRAGRPVTAVDTTAVQRRRPGHLRRPTGSATPRTTATTSSATRSPVTAPDGSVTTTAYDADGEPLSVTGPTGAVTDATYDYLGRQVTAHRRSSGTPARAPPPYTTHVLLRRRRRTRRRLAVAAGQPGRGDHQYAYDAAGEKTAVTDGAGNTTSYSYDSLGRQTKVTYPDGTATATGYDAAGNVSLDQASLDASGNTLATTSAALRRRGRPAVGDRRRAATPRTFTYDPTGLADRRRSSRCPRRRRSPRRSATTRPGTRRCTPTATAASGRTPTTAGACRSPASSRPPAAYSTAANSTFTTAYDADQNPVTRDRARRRHRHRHLQQPGRADRPVRRRARTRPPRPGRSATTRPGT